MIDIKNPNDPTDADALGPSGGMIVVKTPTEYKEPGLPTPPAGWGKDLGMDVKLAPDMVC